MSRGDNQGTRHNTHTSRTDISYLSDTRQRMGTGVVLTTFLTPLRPEYPHERTLITPPLLTKSPS